MPFWDFDDDRFPRPFAGIIFTQFLPQQSGMGTNNTVFAGVVTRRTVKHVDTDLLFGGFLRHSANRAPGDVEQEIVQPSRRFEMLTGGNPLYQLPASIAGYGARNLRAGQRL